LSSARCFEMEPMTMVGAIMATTSAWRRDPLDIVRGWFQRDI
jgi:hypothetical protein